MKYVLCITQRCNLACTYCYIGKNSSRMSLSTAAKIVDFMYANTPEEERIDVAFFGGEPLLEFGLIRSITNLIENHPEYDSERLELSIVTNGTIFSDEIARFVRQHNMVFGISCDGTPEIQDHFRRFVDNRPSSGVVEETIVAAVASLPSVMVNSVHHPDTLIHMPVAVDYFFSLGLRRIHLNPDYSARWTSRNIRHLPGVYAAIGQQFVDYYLRETPCYISLIDSKIAVILRGGYQAAERCRMGRGEYAFSPNGNIYPCERLIQDGEENQHTIGNIDSGLDLTSMMCNQASGGEKNQQCASCSINSYCMNWCGCSNFMATGYYNRVGAFMCASEKAAVQTALDAFRTIENILGPTFVEHLAGVPGMNSFVYQEHSQRSELYGLERDRM